MDSVPFPVITRSGRPGRFFDRERLPARVRATQIADAQLPPADATAEVATAAADRAKRIATWVAARRPQL